MSRFGLTAREAEVLHWIVEGKNNPEIGLILGISPRTVEKHVERVLPKMGVDNRASAIRHVLMEDERMEGGVFGRLFSGGNPRLPADQGGGSEISNGV